MAQINIIFATTNTGLFGRCNKLPFSCKLDMDNFNRITCDVYEKTLLIMGRLTYESLNNVQLLNRDYCVISTHIIDNVRTFGDLDECLRVVRFDKYARIFLIGGASLIESMILNYNNFIDSIYYTVIPDKYLSNEYKSEQDIYININLLNQIKRDNSPIVINDIAFYKIKVKRHEEFQYLDLLQECLSAPPRQTRNSICHSINSRQIKFDVSRCIPVITTKKIYLKGVIEELLFFLRGETDTKILENMNVNIWKGNTSAEFIKSVNLPYREGIMGPMYGYNWIYYGKQYKVPNETQYKVPNETQYKVPNETQYNISTINSESSGINQIEYVLNLLIHDPFSRRILFTSYNPSNVQEGVLFPCHSIVNQFFVEDIKGKLHVSLEMYQRSVDLACGLPFNIASSSLLLHLICATLNVMQSKSTYVPKHLTIDLCDIHIYESHIDQIKIQILRMPLAFPKLEITPKNKYDAYTIHDIKITEYNSHPAIKYQMIS
jgi:dihydrofolate reductase/thymidylate synthase